MHEFFFFPLTHDFSSDPLWQGGLDSHLMKEKAFEKANLKSFYLAWRVSSQHGLWRYVTQNPLGGGEPAPTLLVP